MSIDEAGGEDSVASEDLESQIVVVTGASSGLGESFARSLHSRGARLVLVARSAERLERLSEELDGAVAVAADVTQAADRTAILDRALGAFGGVDALVNNAGAMHPQIALRESAEEFQDALDLNLIAPFALSTLVAPTLRERGGGCIVNVASIYGIRASKVVPSAGYAAAKAGLLGLTRELATQWGRYGIRVNAIAPGLFPSGMGAGDPDGYEQVERWYADVAPLGRAGRLEDFQSVLHMLLDPASEYITGQMIAVDGGWLAA